VVDAATLASMLANLRRYVVVLEGLAAVSKEAFLRNSDRIGNAKYHFVIAALTLPTISSPQRISASPKTMPIVLRS